MAYMTRLVLILAAVAISEAWDFQAVPGSSHVEPGSPEGASQIPPGLATFVGSEGAASLLGRIAELEARMKPLFEALPKSSGGGLNAASARYALQRYFIEQHHWHVEALGTSQGHGGSYAGLRKESAPGRIAAYLETALAGTHFGIRELATVAAAVEKSVRMDSAELLSKALAVHGLSEQDLDEETQDLVIQTFMLFYVLPDSDYSKKGSESIKRYLGVAQRVYPAWTATLQWVQDLKHSVQSEKSTLPNLVEGIVFGYRHLFDNQCSGLRDLLLNLEQPGTGRVLLSKLRNTSSADHILNSIWQFSEGSEELRSMGVLDESDPTHTSVIIPNYILADSNCLPVSQIVSICCTNQCDQLLAGLEEKLQSPEASPKQISDWTRSVSPNIAEALIEQLEAMANSHGTSIPIHSKAFAQWMHGVFPAKCPRQQDAPTLTPQLVSDVPTAVEEWWPSARQAFRGLALVFAAASLFAGLINTIRSQKPRGKDQKDRRCQGVFASAAQRCWWRCAAEVVQVFRQLEEAMAGSHALVHIDADGVVPAALAQDADKLVFMDLDCSGDGSVSLAEYQSRKRKKDRRCQGVSASAAQRFRRRCAAEVVQVFRQLAEDADKLVFMDMDCNGDGFVSLAEYQSCKRKKD